MSARGGMSGVDGGVRVMCFLCAGGYGGFYGKRDWDF